VATQGKGDRDALRVALSSGAGYAGMVCSRKKLDALRTRLLEEATDLAPAFAALHAPAGLDIGAEGPEEIALSIFAEIVAHRRLGVARGTLEIRHMTAP
ncbi:MAG: XdhC family protein, partial [Methyloceanibacter sp.]